MPVAGAIAGATAAAAYLDAKFHIRKDLNALRGFNASQREFEAACMLAPPGPSPDTLRCWLTRPPRRQERPPQSLVLLRKTGTPTTRVGRGNLVASRLLYMGRDVRERVPLCAILPAKRREAR